MNLEDASYLAEIVGGLVVVISIGFLILQLRQTTKAIMLNTGLSITQDIRSLYHIVAVTDDLSNIMFDGFRDAGRLGGVQRFRFFAIMHDYFHTYESAYIQWISGTLDERYWNTMRNGMVTVLATAGGKQYWGDRSWWYSDDFQNFINNHVLELARSSTYLLAGTDK